MSNFGFRRLRVVNSFEPSFREARSAVGASEILAKAEQFKTVAEAIVLCSATATVNTFTVTTHPAGGGGGGGTSSVPTVVISPASERVSATR